MTVSSLQCLLKQKNVAFITVKNKEYIRVSQIERLLKQEALSYIVYSSEKGNPLTRALDLNRRLKNIDLSGADVVILGFLPQLVWKSVSRKLGRKTEIKLDKCSLYGNTHDGNVTLIADFFLSLYDTIALDRKIVSPKGFISQLLRKLDRQALQGADLVITDTKADADFFAAEYDINRDKFEVLYLEADRSVFSYDVNMVNADYQYSDGQGKETSEKKEVLYFGTGLPLQGTDIVLKAFDEISAEEDIKCTYIGGTKGVTKELLGKLHANPNVEIIEWLPQEVLSEKIEGATLCLAGHFNADIDKADRTIPGKAYIYEAMNKKMILGDTKANHELFSEDDKHLFVKRGDSKALAGAIRKCFKL